MFSSISWMTISLGVFYLKSQDSLEEIRPRAPTRALPWTHLLGAGLQHHHHPLHTPPPPPQPLAAFLSLDFSFKLNIFTKSSDSFFFRNKPCLHNYETLHAILQFAILKFSLHTNVKQFTKFYKFVWPNFKVYFTQVLNIFCSILKFGSRNCKQKVPAIQKTFTHASSQPCLSLADLDCTWAKILTWVQSRVASFKYIYN